MVQFLGGPSRFWRCPKCRSIIQKPQASDPFAGTGAMVVGSVTCGSCGASLPRGDIYGGKYDLPEVRLNCPHCGVLLQGPGEDLLGKPCPGCSQILPSR